MTRTLLKHIPLYSVLKRFRFKKDIPVGMGNGAPLLVDFKLWGKWYVVQSFGGLICEDGREMPFHTMYCKDGTVVIGQRDAEAAAGTKYADAWRESIHSENLERIRLL